MHTRSLERQQRILKLLHEQRSLSVRTLTQTLGVSGWTVRRDLEHLERQGYLQRRYGTVLLGKTQFERAVASHELDAVRLEARERIAWAVARRIQPGQHIALSAGSTTSGVAQALVLQNTRCHVFTNALNIASELSTASNIRVTCSGGDVDGDYQTLNGPVTARSIAAHYFDLAIIGVSGLDLQAGLTVNSQLNANALEAMIQNAKQVLVAVDSSKFDVVRFARLASLEDVNVIVTELQPSVTWIKTLHTFHVETVVA